MRRLLVALVCVACLGAQGVTPLPSRVVGGPPPSNFVLQDDANCLGLWIFTTGTTIAEAGDESCTTDRSGVNNYDMTTDGGSDISIVVGGTPAGTPAGLSRAVWTAAATPDDPLYVDDNLGSLDAFEGDDWTIGCWASPDILTSSDIIFTKEGATAFEIQRRSNNNARGIAHGVNVETASPVFTLGTWLHVVLRLDGSATHPEATDNRGELFLNGVLDTIAPSDSPAAPGNPRNIVISGNAFGTGSFFDGSIFECWYVDRVLDNAEICDVMLYGVDGNATAATRSTEFGSAGCQL